MMREMTPSLEDARANLGVVSRVFSHTVEAGGAGSRTDGSYL